MSSHLSRKEIDELKPSIDRLVYKVLGESDSSVVNSIEKCLHSGYDKRKITDKIASYIDSRKAHKITDKLFDLVEDVSHRAKKRSHDESRDRESSKRSKTSKDDRDKDVDPSKLSVTDIKKMMANAKTEIEERKKSLDNIKMPALPLKQIYGIPMGLLNRGDADKARKIAQLQAQIKNKLSTGILGNALNINIPDKPTPLILDDEGRTVDKAGKAIQLTHVVPTLKANIRAKKREEFKAQMNDKVNEDLSETHFFDSRIGVKPALRTKRALRFHEPGKFQQLAERLRMKVSKKIYFTEHFFIITFYRLS